MKSKTWLNKFVKFSASTAAVWLLGASALASDPVGIYAIVDKVVLESAEKPERIQIWGSFSLAQQVRGEAYAKPQAGYLYYKLNPDKPDISVKEWNDLKSIAGKDEVVGFAVRWEEKGTVRKTGQKPDSPDKYPLGIGVQKARRVDYEPVKALRAFHKEQAKNAVQQVSELQLEDLVSCSALPRSITGNVESKKSEISKGSTN